MASPKGSGSSDKKIKVLAQLPAEIGASAESDSREPII